MVDNVGKTSRDKAPVRICSILFCFPSIPQVLYVVRSPCPPSGFLETLVYSDRGGLQCPEPLLPVGPPTPPVRGGGALSSGATGGWGRGRPYVNAHFVLEPLERVVDAKFQPITSMPELAAWGYRVRKGSCFLGGGGGMVCGGVLYCQRPVKSHRPETYPISSP